MTEAITVRFGFDRALMRRALSGWWQSAVPPVPFGQRVLRWVMIWLLVLVATVGLGALGVAPSYVVAGLMGVGVFILGIFGLQRSRMRRFYVEIGGHWDKAGETEATFSADGVTLVDRVSRRELTWPAIDAVRAVRGATVMRSGISMIAVPDQALPRGMKPAEFRAAISAWRSA